MNKQKRRRRRRIEVTSEDRKKILGKQRYKCANYLEEINPEYICPLNEGDFDESGYEFDHIEEYSISQNSNINNIQALCPCCHRVKTDRFNNRNKKSYERDYKILLKNYNKLKNKLDMKSKSVRNRRRPRGRGRNRRKKKINNYNSE